MNATVEPRIHIWTRDEYYKMAEAGLFRDKRVELIEGRVIEMSPMGSVHATAVVLAARTIERMFEKGHVVRWQMPLAIDVHSEPEPDIAVVVGEARDFTYAHPTTAVHVVEVADTSLSYDRTTKASLYARAGIEEYWIVNLVDQRLEVYREPTLLTADTSVFGYAEVMLFKADTYISPLALPHVSIPVADILP